MKTKDRKEKIIITICIAIIILAVGTYFIVKVVTDHSIKQAQKELEDLKNSIGYLEKENVQTLIAKFNKEIMDSNMDYPITSNSLTIENDIYYYSFYDDIIFYVRPLNYTGNEEVDIVQDAGIFLPKDSDNQKIVLTYLNRLLKANNQEITDEEVTSLVEDAKKKASKNQSAYNGKGVKLSYYNDEDDDYIEYIVTRNYQGE